MEASKMT